MFFFFHHTFCRAKKAQDLMRKDIYQRKIQLIVQFSTAHLIPIVVHIASARRSERKDTQGRKKLSVSIENWEFSLSEEEEKEEGEKFARVH